jgi:hypothetical protein
VTSGPALLARGRLELLNVKADLERELGGLVLHCTACGLGVHWVAGWPPLRDIGHTANQRRVEHRGVVATPSGYWTI